MTIRGKAAFIWLVLGVWFPVIANGDDAAPPAPLPLTILSVTPSGENAPAGRQIVIAFSRAVVPIGRMDRKAEELPITLTPELPCQWRWVNTSSLSCNLPEKGTLAFATHYRIEVKPGIKTEDGATIAQPYVGEFITQRPDIAWKQFHLWKAPGHPVIRLVFNQPVTQESVEQHIFMLAEGAAKHFFKPPTDKRIALNASADPDGGDTPAFLPLPGEKYVVFLDQTPKKSDDDKRAVHGKEARRVWLVEPKAEIPLDTHVLLKIESGLVSAAGPETNAKEDVIVTFDTFPAFAFLGATCALNNNESLSILAGSTTPAGKCNPLEPVHLIFNAPVERAEVGKALHFNPPVRGWKKGEEETAGDVPEEVHEQTPDDYDHIAYELKQEHKKDQTYDIWLPGGLKAAQEYHMESRSASMGYFARAWHWSASWFSRRPPIEVQDMFGREVDEHVAAVFATDHRKSHFVFDHHNAVLEKSVDSEVPLFVNNLESTTLNYRSVKAAVSAEGQALTKAVPKVEDVQFAVPFGIREALGGDSGAVYGSLSQVPAPVPVEDCTYECRIFAQVTPYQVHLKLGHFSSIAWVTDLATGEPVEGAKVILYKDAFTTLGAPKDIAGTAVTDALGIAALPGTAEVDPDLKASVAYGDDKDTRFFLRVEKGADMALLPLAYEFMINSYRASGSDYIYPNNKERYGHMHVWGMTAQGIYRAGDTMQYKIYVRNQDTNRFVPPPLKGYRLSIIDAMGKKVHEVKHVTLSPFGSFSGEYTIPKEASVGWYTFRLAANFDGVSESEDSTDEQSADEQTGDENVSEEGGEEQNNESGKHRWVPMRVLVSDFTPASYKVSGQLGGDHFRAGQEVDSITRAELHSGGPYTQASARVTAMLQSMPFVSKHPLAKDFRFDSFENERDSQEVFQKIDTLNDKGELQQKFTINKPDIVYGTLMVESAVQDDRGKYIAGSARADYVGVSRLVGLRSKEWLLSVGKPATIDYIVVDDRGTPAAGTEVAITLEHEITKAARVKSAGNAYLTEYNTEWQPAGDCKGTSEAQASACSFTPKQAGIYRATATIKDTRGNPHMTKLSVYATGGDFVLWDDENDTSLTIVPEKTDYKIGDTARYLVKNPYPGAKALITVERYGVLDRFVQTLSGSTPVIEFPIKPDYLPGFYLSVTVMSPRVDKPMEGQVDLGKPAFRMGYLTVPVKDPYKEMLVEAKTDQPVYKPRDKVTVTVHAEPRKKDTDAPVEIAAVVLDESVFNLIAKGKDAFDAYKGFYTLESLDIRNYSLLLKLVGRQKFEKKGVSPGGDGGHDATMRSLFKFVSYWNPSITPDKNGNATFTFDAPDNLTGWRILAIATTPGDRFGLGEANFKVNRPTEVRPVMPNQVTEGDRFDAGFSVMNRTDKPRTLKVTITAEGNVEKAEPLVKEVKLDAYKRTTVLMPVKTTPVPIERDVTEGAITFRVTAGDDTDEDGLTHKVVVNKQRSLEVAANYATTTEAHAEESLKFPDNLVPDVGSVSVVATPSVIGGVSGAFKYLRDYPYMCWEQQLTKGVMAAHFKELKSYLPENFAWKDSEALPQKTLDNAVGFQAPSGGMAYYTPQDKYVDPYLSAYTALAFNWLRADGYKVPEEVESKLQKYLEGLLRNDAMPDFYSEGMSASVRAVALAALAERGKIGAADIERYSPHVAKMSLFGKAQFLNAALKVGKNEKEVEDTVRQLLNASGETGGKFTFSETLDDGYIRILATPLRDNCAVLESFVRYAATPKGKEQAGDVPFKLVRAITQSRKNREHWENTQENMFCMNALIDYARVYEKPPVDMTVKASMDGTNFGEAAFKSVRDKTVTMERAIAKDDAGRSAKVTIDKVGSGRLYYATRMAYALPPGDTKPADAGIEVHREYSVERGGKWELLKNAAEIKRGELVRIDLYISAPVARNFVVVDDPIPGGLEPVNSQLATASSVDATKGEFAAAGGAWWFHFSDWVDYGVSRWSFYHQELRDKAARFYSDYLPAGNYHLSYTAQAIATGDFAVMPAMAQEMYDPEVYGKTEAMTLHVGEK